MSKLVIVESPAKAKTIERYLPDGFVVMASKGHVRDLPDKASQMPEKLQGESWASLGVNTEKDFEAFYVVKEARSKKVLTELRDELKNADELYLATDEDREGEAISWHLKEALSPKVPIKRMVFNEITKTAIQNALHNTRTIDMKMVEAQETRRILDRLVGYPLSDLVRRKVFYKLSAGRVQSAAVRMLVERERERRKFRAGSYWDLKTTLKIDEVLVESTLREVDGKRLATGRDFDENTGQIASGKDVLQLDSTSAKAFEAGLVGKDLKVTETSERPYETSPNAPFTTSTLQQEASRKLSMSAKDTMSTAQSLYENGHITYMRTDSTNLSQQAVDAARTAATQLYGAEYLPAEARQYSSKSKNAQEAHEAIRPSGDSFAHPDAIGLSGVQKRLYELIWMRTVACQMANAKRTSLRVDLEADVNGQTLGFAANGNRIDFPGFMRAYVEGSDDPTAALDDRETLLPDMAVGDDIPCATSEAVGHDTQPPRRFTEASLAKAMEEAGIGRPSTYASIIEKISRDNRYARKQGRTLTPTYEALAVTELLEEYFPELVEREFTAKMEDDLDAIATGDGTKVAYLHKFWRAEGALSHKIAKTLDDIELGQARSIVLPDLPEGMEVRVGKYGPYVRFEHEGEQKSVDIPEDVAPAELTEEIIMARLEEMEAGPKELGEFPETKEMMYLMAGPFGPYVQLGEKTEENPKPKRSSLPKGVEKDQVGFDEALQLMSLPRVVGNHPDTDVEIQAGLGRYGPYIKMDKDYRNVADFDALFSVTLEEAVAVFAQPKRGRGQRSVLREVGKHPTVDAEDRKSVV